MLGGRNISLLWACCKGLPLAVFSTIIFLVLVAIDMFLLLRAMLLFLLQESEQLNGFPRKFLSFRGAQHPDQFSPNTKLYMNKLAMTHVKKPQRAFAWEK